MAHVKTVTNTDWTSAGVGGMRNYGYGTLNVSGITGSVTSAMLYWHGPTNSGDPLANASVMFAGNPITGTNIGFSSDNCWGYRNSQAYQADVTEFVTGIGLYELTGFGRDPYYLQKAINTNGASLVVTYDDGDDTNNRDIAVFSGNDSNIWNSFDQPGWNFTLSPINYTRGIGTLQMHVADGQRWVDGAVYVNNREIAARGAIFEGDSVPSNNTGPFGYGHLWDIRDFDVTEDLAANPNSLQVTSSVYSDCLAGIVMIVDLPVGAAPPPEPASNNPPVADAGKDGTIKAGASTKLDGTQSYDSDPDDAIVAYDWSLIAGAPVSISSANTATPTITSLSDMGDMTATFELEVTDKGGLTSTDTVMVTIVKNSAPVADAGVDQTKDEGELVTLNGTKSRDPDIGDSLTFAWSQTLGPKVELSDASSATPDFPAPSVATRTLLAFQLTVTDDDNPSGTNLLSDTDDVMITVRSVYDAMQCNVAKAEPGILWPPNHKLRQVNITGLSDATITVTSITQDESTNGLGDGDTGPDGILGTASVEVRAERSGLEDGRVYVIGFTADNGYDICSGSVSVGVPHDKRGDPAVDSGQSYDSTILTSPTKTASSRSASKSKKNK
ncbi:MAG: hypothetical protein V3T02_02455 [Alphaproteobacteria bacterium]